MRTAETLVALALAGSAHATVFDFKQVILGPPKDWTFVQPDVMLHVGDTVTLKVKFQTPWVVAGPTDVGLVDGDLTGGDLFTGHQTILLGTEVGRDRWQVRGVENTYTLTGPNNSATWQMGGTDYVAVRQGIPEPAAWALMMLGVGLTGAALRGNRQRRITQPVG